jgi:hypothetical protein
MATPTSLPGAFTAGDVLTAANMNGLRGAFRILQVVSATKTDTFSTTSTSFTNVTGLTVSITPSATSSKVLVCASVSYSVGNTADDNGHLQLAGGNCSAYVGDSAGSRTRGANFITNASNWGIGQTVVNVPLIYLDSPSTTSATTYSVQAKRGTASGTVWVNRSVTDTDAVGFARTASTITVMEISA